MAAERIRPVFGLLQPLMASHVTQLLTRLLLKRQPHQMPAVPHCCSGCAHCTRPPPWGESTCSEAAAGGHLEVLLWARANGCREQ